MSNEDEEAGGGMRVYIHFPAVEQKFGENPKPINPRPISSC
jgi:hypothetical protein